jgi:hypothetical protein
METQNNSNFGIEEVIDYTINIKKNNYICFNALYHFLVAP